MLIVPLCLVGGIFWGDSYDVLYFFDHMGHKSWSLVRNDSFGLVYMLSLDVEYDAGNCYGILVCCRVGKQLSWKQIHGCHFFFIATGRRLFGNKVSLHGIFCSCDVFARSLRRWATESVVDPWFADALFTRLNPLLDLLSHVRVVLSFCVNDYCLGYSRMLTKFSLEVPENFINELFLFEDLIVFDATAFPVFFPEQQAIFEYYAIFICFVVPISSVCCQ